MPALVPANIHVGRGEVWVGGTAPSGGSDLTDPTSSQVNAMASGFTAPTSGGTYVGSTTAPTTIVYKPTYYAVSVEQTLADVAVIPTAEEATVDMTMAELSADNIKVAWSQASEATSVTPAYKAVFVGGKTALTATPTVTVFSPKRTGIGYYITTVYQTYSMNGAPFSFDRKKETDLKVTLRSLAATGRPIGDQIFQVVAYDANPA